MICTKLNVGPKVSFENGIRTIQECSSFSRPVFTAALTIRDTLQRSGVLLNQLYTAPIMSTALKTN